MDNWRPMETAPIDAAIIVAVPSIRHHQMEVSYAVGEACWSDDEGSFYWANNDPSDTWGGPIYPTHWMPMPAPPTSGDVK